MFFNFFFFLSFEGRRPFSFLLRTRSIGTNDKQLNLLSLLDLNLASFSSPVFLQVLSSRSPLENSPQPLGNFLLSFCFFFLVFFLLFRNISPQLVAVTGVFVGKVTIAINKNSVENKGYIRVFKNSIKNAPDNEKGRRK